MIDTDRLRWAARIAWLQLRGKKRTALASFPRSGNTWLRFMIEVATGQLSGSVYHDRILSRSHEGIVIKTHKQDAYCYTDAIHVLRNPFDAIESYYHWKQEIGSKPVTWDEHVHQATQDWMHHTYYWLTARLPVYRARYEDFKQAPHQQLANLMTWLGYPLTPEKVDAVVEASTLEKMRTAEGKLGSQFFRRGQVGAGELVFTPEQRNYMLTTLAHLLPQAGYAGLLEKNDQA